MTKAQFIKKKDTTTRDTAVMLAGLCVDWKIDCNHNCDECVDMIEKFLTEDCDERADD